MKLDMDKIQFESRYEIETIIEALEKCKDKNEIVQNLIDKLDAMYLSW